MNLPPNFCRRIAHLDMDAFFASVELLRYPQLAGLPVVIGGKKRSDDENEQAAHKRSLEDFPRLEAYSGRGVITTATYAARAFGVGSAMGLMKAAKLCPQAILLPVDFDEYRRFSRLFKSVIAEHADLIEDRGIDEVFIDFTEAKDGQSEGGRVLAARIQAAIFAKTGLTCSIGVAPNKLIAKMASEFHKPNGIAIVYEDELKERIHPLACRKINGIGPRTEARLKSLGIFTIGELATHSEDWLVHTFGTSYGKWLFAAARGQDERPLVTKSEPVSISRETTFERNLHARHDRALLSNILTSLCERVASDLKNKAYLGKSVSIKIKYADFRTVTRDIRLEEAVGSAHQIRHAARQCLKRVDLSRPFRLLGVRVGRLISPEEVAHQKAEQKEAQLSLW